MNLRVDVVEAVQNAPRRLLDVVVDSTFRFKDQPRLPSQGNFAPVAEIGEAVNVAIIEGAIPQDFPEGIYVRNGSNPQFGALQSTESVLGRSSDIWVEGEGMLHALYFTKNGDEWRVEYKNRYVETETFLLERERGRPSFLPAIEGDSPAVLAAYLFNQLRFGNVNKNISNTNVFEYSGRFFSVAENSLPQEIDIFSLDAYGNWDISGSWDRPFTAHPKRAPGSGELVILGVDAKKPFVVLGVISADGKKLKHKVDLKFKRSSLSHELGVTEMYNVIFDMPVTIDINRLIKGGPLIKYEKESYARIGVMPRYGDVDSVIWFEVERCCTFHIINCFENGDEVVVRGCRARESIIPGPDLGRGKHQWFSEGFKPTVEKDRGIENSRDGFLFSHVYEWRLNMKTGNVVERYLTGIDHSIDFPMINDQFIGLYNSYAYGQVIDSVASSISALPKFGGLAKFHLSEQVYGISELDRYVEDLIRVELHQFGENQFCSGAAFVPKQGASEEDDGWIISFVHNEETNISQVHIIDTKRFEGDPVAKFTLPQRVPYGFHGIFLSKSLR